MTGAGRSPRSALPRRSSLSPLAIQIADGRAAESERAQLEPGAAELAARDLRRHAPGASARDFIANQQTTAKHAAGTNIA
jgi:hypothetical protein